MTEHIFDVAIIGGGINGCGCAADAAMRGLNVVLFEQGDLASKTSSTSTKLIHGGLRYLEYYEFALVKKALEERQRLLNLAPHIVHPQSFVLPYEQHMRPSWLLRLGLFIYDHLSKENSLPRSKTVLRSETLFFEPLKAQFTKGYIFNDAATDDARLTIANALQAKQYGASIRPQEKIIHIQSINTIWHLTIEKRNGHHYQIQTKSLINAAGPWVSQIADLALLQLKQSLSLVKGSHILVPKLYEGVHAYFLQNKDNRIIFVIPYHGYSMIGTTDIALSCPTEQPIISTEELNYLLDIVNSYFAQKLSSKDVIDSWSGIRPLLATQDKNPSALSRDYAYEVHQLPAFCISILGGKITTYRQLAAEVIDKLAPLFPNLTSSNTKYTPLPGACSNSMNYRDYCNYAATKYTWLPHELLNRYLQTYGTDTEKLLSSCDSISCLGKLFGKELYEIEIAYLIKNEWATSCEDIIMRRTKLGLGMSDETRNEIAFFLAKIDAKTECIS